MADRRGRNEGAEPDSSYKPPKTMKKISSIDEEATSAGFEWDGLHENPDIDIWAVRIPAGFRASDLVGLKIKLPASDVGDVSGTLKNGNTNFKLRTVGGEDGSRGGEEMQNLRCMAPKKSEPGALYQLPKPIKHLILTPQDPIPVPASAPAAPAQSTKRLQPIARLKHSFAPIGATPLSPPSSSRTMDLDQETEVVKAESPKKRHKKQAASEEVAVATVVPDKKEKGKGKEKANTVQADVAGEAMEVDDIVEAKSTKKPKKKSAAAMEPEPQEEEVTAKKGKKKRKAAGDD